MPPLTSRAQMMRAILLARATVTSIFRLASQHLRKPRALGCPASAGLSNHGTRPNDQETADRPFTAFRNGPEFLLAAGRFLQRRQSEPGREIAPGREPFG